MPAGVPVATFAIGAAGATNAALCAAAILANKHPAIATRARGLSRTRRPPACSAIPIRARLRAHDGRHRGRRPARPHARFGGLPARTGFPVPGPGARAPAGQVAPLLQGAFTDRRLLARLARRCEVRHLRLGERVGGAACAAAHARARRAHLPAARGARRRPGPGRREAPVRAARHPHHALARRRLARPQLDARHRRDRSARRAQDPPPRLRRQGPGACCARRRDAEQAWRALGQVPLLYEECVPFDCEVSIIGARSASGEIAVYPLSGNVHGAGILRLTLRALRPAALAAAAPPRYLPRVLRALPLHRHPHHRVLRARGRLIANEMAPRVHNSGHWTIEGAVTSQFENHLRAILGLPLGATRARGYMRHDQSHRPAAGARGAAGACRACTCTTTASSRGPGARSATCTVVEPTAPRARRARAAPAG